MSLSHYPNLAVIQLNTFLLKINQTFSVIMLHKAEMKWSTFHTTYKSDYIRPEIIFYFRFLPETLIFQGNSEYKTDQTDNTAHGDIFVVYN